MHPNVRLALYFFLHALKATHWRLVAGDLIAAAHEKRAELAYEACGQRLVSDKHAECVCGEHRLREHDDQDWRDEKADRQ